MYIFSDYMFDDVYTIYTQFEDIQQGHGYTVSGSSGTRGLMTRFPHSSPSDNSIMNRLIVEINM